MPTSARGLPFSDLERNRGEQRSPSTLVMAEGEAQQKRDVRISQNRHEEFHDCEQN